jgi:hypothetical protein
MSIISSNLSRTITSSMKPLVRPSLVFLALKYSVYVLCRPSGPPLPSQTLQPSPRPLCRVPSGSQARQSLSYPSHILPEYPSRTSRTLFLSIISLTPYGPYKLYPPSYALPRPHVPPVEDFTAHVPYSSGGYLFGLFQRIRNPNNS